MTGLLAFAVGPLLNSNPTVDRYYTRLFCSFPGTKKLIEESLSRSLVRFSRKSPLNRNEKELIEVLNLCLATKSLGRVGNLQASRAPG